MCINYTYTYKSCTITRKEIYDEIKTSETVKVIGDYSVFPTLYIAKLARIYNARVHCCAACFTSNEALATLCKWYSFGFYLFFPRVALYSY